MPVRRVALLRAFASTSIVAIVGTTMLAPAHAADKAACVASFDSSQRLMKQGKLLSARAELLVCTNESCPEFIVEKCQEWLSETDKRLATIVVKATDATSQPVTDVRMFVDGVAIGEQVSTEPIKVDPGERTLRFEDRDGAIFEKQVSLREGERNREIQVSFVGAPRRAIPMRKKAEAANAAAWTLGGIGVVALGGFGYFGLRALGKSSDMRSTCAPACSADDVREIKTLNWLSGISLGVGIASLGAATVLFVTQQPQRTTNAAAIRFDLQPLPGGGVAEVRGGFR